MQVLTHKNKAITKRRKAHYQAKVAEKEPQYGRGTNVRRDQSPKKTALAADLHQLTKRIEAAMAQMESEGSTKQMNFEIVLERGRVRFKTIDSPGKTEAQMAEQGQKETVNFDPVEAGRQAVATMQGAEGGAWTGQELARQFDLTAAALHKRRKEFRIVSWRDAKHDFHYPRWQFTPTGAMLQGVQAVLQTFRSTDEWRVMRYFLAPRHQLEGRAVLDLLRAGEVDKVVAHAKAHGEENSW